SLQGEVGAKAFVTDKTRVNLALFQISTSDEIVVASATGGRTAFANAKSTLRQGVELGAESDLTKQLTAKGAFTFLHAIYDQPTVISGVAVPEGNFIPAIPEYSAYGELDWTPIKGLTFGAETIYRSQLYVNDANDAHTAPGHVLENL